MVLAALLRRTCGGGRPAKVVVFMSSCDAVEFVHALLAEAVEAMEGAPLLPCPILKLHGNLPQVGTRRTCALLRMVTLFKQPMRSLPVGRLCLSGAGGLGVHTVHPYTYRLLL